jgi:hypothetical protein
MFRVNIYLTPAKKRLDIYTTDLVVCFECYDCNLQAFSLIFNHIVLMFILD